MQLMFHITVLIVVAMLQRHVLSQPQLQITLADGLLMVAVVKIQLVYKLFVV